jgi:hypothetical protein
MILIAVRPLSLFWILLLVLESKAFINGNSFIKKRL